MYPSDPEYQVPVWRPTVLNQAVARGDTHLVSRRLNAGVSQDNLDQSLIIAVSVRNPVMVTLLVTHGANPMAHGGLAYTIAWNNDDRVILDRLAVVSR